MLTAHHWRTIRLKLIGAGITDPMQLPTMHILLDETERTILESMHAETGKDAEFKRTSFLNSLYAPTVETKVINGKKVTVAPEGFEDDDVEAAFDAFARASASDADYAL